MSSCAMGSSIAKSNWTLEQLGWKLHPAGDLAAWDGLLGWFTEHIAQNPSLLDNPLVRRWHKAVVARGRR